MPAAAAPLKVAVLADGGRLPRFACDAIRGIEGCEGITLFSCTNTRTRKRLVKHAGYYALNLLSVRNAQTRALPAVECGKRIDEEVEFESLYDGAWQRLPEAVVGRLSGFDVVLKIGMGLMRVPGADVLPVPILSYHHGDPDRYRGRPAGFWEIVEGTPVMGQMVQAIGDKLDAGRVVAYAETKVYPWSFRKTLVESFAHSPLILNAAIRNALSGADLGKPCKGRNYRLPSNLTVAAFVLRMAARFLRRLLYGALVEKKWKVSLADASGPAEALFDGRSFPPRSGWRTLEEAKNYVFYADPFFSADPPGLLVEALSREGIGEIVLVGDEGHRRVSNWPGHLSYPATVEVDGRQLLLPEMAATSAPILFTLESGAMVPVGPLPLAKEARIADPTIVKHQGRVYLFGTLPEVGNNVLHLWSADSMAGPFVLHPQSPVRISPAGSRMAGQILHAEAGLLLRLGQDFRMDYGDGIFAFAIEEMSASAYREREIGELRFSGVRGPHTLNVRGGELLFDWYVDSVSPAAGLRRLFGRLRRRQAARASSE
ncbi:MAG: hypothetical protein E6G94_12460 [Alphaproteobacteria bacterium]|nr:MAG: hypothetical protein E6G94_12460 [Alphaproteobacteria bacterium]